MQQRELVVAFFSYKFEIALMLLISLKGVEIMELGQLITAMVTPFNEDKEIDYEKTSELLDHLIENGTDAVVVAGTTGESPTLSEEEKLGLFEHVVKYVAGRIPVIAGTGCHNTSASIELTKKAESLGVDAIMLVIPYYNKPSQEGLYEHFKVIAAETTLPVMLYNIPGRSACNLDAETTIRLAEIENIKYIKEASANLEQMTHIIRETPDDFKLYSGDDSFTLPIMSIGGVGVVSVAGHIVGSEMKEMIQSFNAGEVKKASELHQELLPFFKAMFIAPNPTALKAGLNKIGVNVGGLRLPLIEANDIEHEIVDQALKNRPVVQ